MRKLAIVLILLLIVASGAFCLGARFAAPTKATAIPVELDAAYWTDFVCQDNPPSACGNYRVTFVIIGNEVIAVQVDPPLGKVKVGDLLMAWGTPSGADYEKHGIRLYWADREAFIVEPGSPGADVGEVQYGPQDGAHGPYKGLGLGR